MSSIDRLNRFVMNPTNLEISRSKFKRPHTHKTTFNSGVLFPIYLDEVLPGDTFKVDFSAVVRMLTPVVPVMDDSFLDVYFFFVPNRIACLGEHDWAKIQGENFNSAWADEVEYTLQNTGNTFTLKELKEAGINIFAGSIMNHLGLPVLDFSKSQWAAADTTPISLLPITSFYKIFNEFFRDQNIVSPLNINKEICLLAAGFNAVIPGIDERMALSVSKFHDYFTSALPSPQKGNPVLIPMGTTAPVNFTAYDESSDEIVYKNQVGNLEIDVHNNVVNPNNIDLISPDLAVRLGLTADLSNATNVTINQLRQAFAIQKMLEKDARGGTRYREMIKAHFGVTLPDYTAQVPQYLGGKRIPINISQVLQTSETNNSPLGSTGAFSNTATRDSMFIKSFVEHGQLLGVACVRTAQSYSQGISKSWTRNRRFDWYFPSFANLGEQPIKRTELYIPQHNQATDSLDEIGEVFGYQEAWAEYRYHPNLVTGHLAPNANDPLLTPWTYTNKFTDWPILNEQFIFQSPINIGDTLVTNDTPYQFIADFAFDVECTRPMPLYSIPGLIDHH